MKINSLAHLKRILQPGVRMRTIQHLGFKMIIAIREVSAVQTNGVFLRMADQPEHPMSTCNGGRGSFFPHEKSSQYEFGDTIKLFKTPEKKELYYEFEVLG